MKAHFDLVVIDTSAWIEFFRSRGNVAMRNQVTDLVRSRKAAWCEIIRLELWNGASGQRELRELEQMESCAKLLPANPEVWKLADHFARSARRGAKTYPVSDLVIAACARHYGAGLLHVDGHFDEIEQIR